MTFQAEPAHFRDGCKMKKFVIVAALVALTGCSTVGTATGTVGTAAKSTVSAITGFFGG